MLKVGRPTVEDDYPVPDWCVWRRDYEDHGGEA